jgi:hypothetical protein
MYNTILINLRKCSREEPGGWKWGRGKKFLRRSSHLRKFCELLEMHGKMKKGKLSQKIFMNNLKLSIFLLFLFFLVVRVSIDFGSEIFCVARALPCFIWFD